jgi:hypothetical protein
VRTAQESARRSFVEYRVSFRVGDLFETDLSEATVVTIYLLPALNAKLRPNLLSGLRPGSRVVSHAFDMGDWAPDETAIVDGRRLYLWHIR